MTHRSFTHTGFLLQISIAETGQFFAHSPQPMQELSTLK